MVSRDAKIEDIVQFKLRETARFQTIRESLLRHNMKFLLCAFECAQLIVLRAQMKLWNRPVIVLGFRGKTTLNDRISMSVHSMCVQRWTLKVCEKLLTEIMTQEKWLKLKLSTSNTHQVAYLHDSYVIWEWGDSQPFDHDVRQVVGVQHQVVPAVLQELLIILALIFPHVAHCSWNTHTHIHTAVRSQP